MILGSEEEARAFCAGLTDAAGMARLERLAVMLIEENARQNLIAKSSEEAMRPETECFLVESRKKRVDWLERAAADLGLKKCRVEGKRLEHVESFEAAAISARAFAPLVKLLALSARFSTQRTVWLLPKGRSAVQELSSLSERTGSMFHVEQSVTDREAGIVVGTGRPTSS